MLQLPYTPLFSRASVVWQGDAETGKAIEGKKKNRYNPQLESKGIKDAHLYLYYLSQPHSLQQYQEQLTLLHEHLKRLESQSWVLLETCDRLEFYCTPSLLQETWMFDPDVWLRKEHGEALQHLFRVTSGLESPLFGEKAIQGQVKQSYQEAILRCAAQSLSGYPRQQDQVLEKSLHQAFQAALRTGKRVRRETLLDVGAMSHARATWEIIQQVLGRIPESNNFHICFLGISQCNQDLAKLLRRKGLQKFFLGNRSYDKACAASLRWGGQAFHLNQLAETLQHCQLVVSASKAPHYLLRPEHILPREQALYLFDLAVPCDIDPEVLRLQNTPVQLWNIRDIENKITNNCQQRRNKAAWAEQIIACELESFYASA